MNAEALNALVLAELPRAQRGDQAAYGRIVAACQGGISAIALAMVRDVHASEDIAQEAFIKAWANMRRLRNPSSFLPWLRQITRNLARDHLRGRKADQAGAGGADFDVVLATVADPAPDHDEQLARQQEEAIVADLIDDLPQDTREILLIYYREGQSSKQVAQLLGLQDAAVRKRLSRARQTLREDLLSRLGDFARSSAPTAAFTALVVAGIALSTPAAAAGFAGGAMAASKGLGKLSAGVLGRMGAAGGGSSRLMIGLAGGIVLALVISLAALFIGLRRYWVTAIDAQEKKQLAVFAASGVGVILLFTLAMGQAVHMQSAVLPTLSFVALMLALGLMNILWLPRILERRHAIEARANPGAAVRARRIERRNAWLGMLIGVVLGSAGLAFGLVSSGRF